MKAILIVVTALLAMVLVMWFIGAVTSDSAVEHLGDDAWPAGLGTLASVEARVRPQQTNDAARQLIALAKPLDISFGKTPQQRPAAMKGAIANYLKVEHMRTEPTIGAPPPEVAAFLAEHEAAIDALRDHLLHVQPIAWEIDASKGHTAPLPNLLAHMHIGRLLTARALDRGRANDVRAWDDLHAARRLTESLEARPELITQLIALAITRLINTTAWKLPPADAPWLAEMQKVDHRRLLLAASQYDTWIMWRGEGQMEPSFEATVMKPYVRWSMIDIARHQRETAAQIAAMTTCSFDGAAFYQQRMTSIAKWNLFADISMPNLGSAWQRAFRTIAEREATANAMRIAQGQPIVAKSACSDGTWSYENGRLSFSRDLPRSSFSENAMPLSLAIPARATRRST